MVYFTNKEEIKNPVSVASMMQWLISLIRDYLDGNASNIKSER